LTKSGALINKFIPIERNRIANAIKDATTRGDEKELAMLKKELGDLDGPKLAYSTSMQPSPKKNAIVPGMSQQERLAVLNKQNRAKNQQDVRQAQINERRAHKLAEAAIARGEDVVTDHSRRVVTKAKFKHDVADLDKPSGSGTTTPVVGTPDLSAKKVSTPIPYLQKLQNNSKGLPTIRRPLMDDDIIGAIDFDIDIEI